MALCHFTPAEKLAFEIFIKEWQLLILLLINVMEKFCTNQAGEELGKDALGKVRQRKHLSIVCEEEAVVGTARGQFKGILSKCSLIVHIITKVRREAAQIQYKNNII